MDPGLVGPVVVLINNVGGNVGGGFFAESDSSGKRSSIYSGPNCRVDGNLRQAFGALAGA